MGHWIDKPTGAYGRWQSWCSACGNHSGIGGIESNRHKPFCPICGERMDGKPKTNGDWFRTLPDEELANQLCDHACTLCPITPCEGRMEIGRGACYKRWLHYLQSPVNGSDGDG